VARGRRADVGLVAAALLFGAFSLTYPFGHDQGLFHYVGREWLVHGRMPYRDCVDENAPGIYLLTGVLVLLFGEQQLAVRVVDLLTVVLTGVLASWVGTPRGQSPPPGRVGFTTFAASVFYYGFFYFWDTAHCELYFGALMLGSHVAAARMRRLPWAGAAAGALAGAAFVMKPTSAFFLPIVLGVLAARAWQDPEDAGAKQATIAPALFAAGFAAIVGSTIALFALRGALGDMVDLAVRSKAHYAAHDIRLISARGVFLRVRDVFGWFNPFSSLVLGGYAAALIAQWVAGASSLLRRLALPAAYIVAALLSILVQLDYNRYYWTAFVGPAAIFAATAHSILLGVPAAGSGRGVAVSLAGAVLLCYGLADERTEIVWNGWRNAALWLSGAISREQFAYKYAMPAYPMRYWYHDSEMAGLWLRENSDPHDNVSARGFQPEIYEIARRSYRGRFFWTYFLSGPEGTYRQEEWLAQDREDILRDPPRFVVTLADVFEGVESLEWFESLGLHYEPRGQWGFVTVSELVKDSALAGSRIGSSVGGAAPPPN
jgi:hypothetical protein